MPKYSKSWQYFVLQVAKMTMMDILNFIDINGPAPKSEIWRTIMPTLFIWKGLISVVEYVLLTFHLQTPQHACPWLLLEYYLFWMELEICKYPVGQSPLGQGNPLPSPPHLSHKYIFHTFGDFLLRNTLIILCYVHFFITFELVNLNTVGTCQGPYSVISIISLFYLTVCSALFAKYKDCVQNNILINSNHDCLDYFLLIISNMEMQLISTSLTKE